MNKQQHLQEFSCIKIARYSKGDVTLADLKQSRSEICTLESKHHCNTTKIVIKNNIRQRLVNISRTKEDISESKIW